MLKNNNKQHHWLVAGEVHFLPIVDGEEVAAPQASKLNAVIKTNSKQLGVREIGKAQQALQMNHHKQMDDPQSYKIFDVFIGNLVYLGNQSDAEFQNANLQEAEEVAVSLPMLSSEKH